MLELLAAHHCNMNNITMTLSANRALNFTRQTHCSNKSEADSQQSSYFWLGKTFLQVLWSVWRWFQPQFSRQCLWWMLWGRDWELLNKPLRTGNLEHLESSTWDCPTKVQWWSLQFVPCMAQSSNPLPMKLSISTGQFSPLQSLPPPASDLQIQTYSKSLVLSLSFKSEIGLDSSLLCFQNSDIASSSVWPSVVGIKWVEKKSRYQTTIGLEFSKVEATSLCGFSGNIWDWDGLF